MSDPQPSETDPRTTARVRPWNTRALPWVSLAVVLFLAAGLRYEGIQWGLPGPTHIFSYHPDEFHSLRGAFSLILTGDLNPHFFNYGSLYLYLVAAADFLANPGNLGAGTTADLERLMHQWTLAARQVNVICALLTVLGVFFLGRELFGGRLAVMAALGVALMPLHVLHSHYATVDVPLTLFVTLALVFSAKIAQYPSTRNYLLAGICAGLATSVKYSGAVVIIAPLVAHLVVRRGADRDSPALLSWQPFAMVGLMIAAFLVTSPYTVLDWSHARQDILFEMHHMRVGEEPARSADPNGWAFHAMSLTLTTSGATVVALLGIIGLFWRRIWRPALGTLVFGVVWFAIIAMANVRYQRYELPLVPVLAVLVAAAPLAIYQRQRIWTRLLAVLVPGAVLAWAISTSVTLTGSLARFPDARDRGLQVILRKVPPGQKVGMIWPLWFNVPPVDPCNGGQVLRHNPFWRQFRHPLRPLVVTGMNLSALAREKPYAFVYSNFETRDFLRIHDHNAEQFLAQVQDNREVTVIDTRQAPLAGLWGWQPPQDWLYPFPTITICTPVPPGPTPSPRAQVG